MDGYEYYSYKEKKTHTREEFPYNVYPCTIPLDFPDVPLHWHDEAEIIAVKKGRGRILVNMVEKPVGAGDIVLILPGQLHAISPEEPEETAGNAAGMEYENIIFRRSLLAGADTPEEISRILAPFLFPEEAAGSGAAGIPSFVTGDLPGREELYALIEETDEVCDRRPAGWQLMVQANLLRFFYTLLQHLPEMPDSQARISPKNLGLLRRVTEYAGSHLTDRISIAQMAELTGFSETHFIRFFKQCTGLHFTEWLNRYRLSMAARLLLISDAPITEVAAEAGFFNLSYFNRTFKARYGVTPRDYRKRNG
ncbi:MAG: AraC family transcriptional regulator [Lachnospiraceae bacterium]|jgi:AraC-like DNA-binding protein